MIKISLFIKNMFVLGIISLMFFIPLIGVVHAADVNTGIVTSCWGSNCDFNQLVSAVKKVIDAAFGLGLTFSVVVIAFAGFKYMTSEGNPAKLKEAHDMFFSVAKGIFFVLAAWLIVNLIMTALVDQGQVTNILK